MRTLTIHAADLRDGDVSAITGHTYTDVHNDGGHVTWTVNGERYGAHDGWTMTVKRKEA